MSNTDRVPTQRGMDVRAVAEFVKGYQQQGLQRALAVGGPFFVVGMAKGLRDRRGR